MSATDVLHNYYDAFNRHDWDTMLGLLTDDVVHDINQGTREVGREAFKAFLDRMDTAYREVLSNLVVMATPDGTRAAAEFIIDGEYLVADEGMPAAHGQRYHLPVGAFFELRDGRIARVTNFYNLTDWLRQVA